MTAILAILTGFLRGIKEGMVMHKPGVREHRWYRWYHAISGLVFCAFAWMVYRWRDHRPGILAIIGILLLMWEFTEVGYALSRSLWGYEHIAFLDIISIELTGWRVYALHAARITGGITLSKRGMT